MSSAAIRLQNDCKPTPEIDAPGGLIGMDAEPHRRTAELDAADEEVIADDASEE